jgi:hypothetical protein
MDRRTSSSLKRVCHVERRPTEGLIEWMEWQWRSRQGNGHGLAAPVAKPKLRLCARRNS